MSSQGGFLEKRFSGSLEGSEVWKREYLLCGFHQSLVAVFLVLHPEDLPPPGNRAPVRPNKGDSSLVRVSQKPHKKTLRIQLWMAWKQFPEGESCKIFLYHTYLVKYLPSSESVHWRKESRYNWTDTTKEVSKTVNTTAASRDGSAQEQVLQTTRKNQYVAVTKEQDLELDLGSCFIYLVKYPWIKYSAFLII